PNHSLDRPLKHRAPTVSRTVTPPSTLDTYTSPIRSDDKAPSLTLVKHVTNDNGGTRTAAEWTLSATGSASTPTNLSGAGGASSSSSFKADTYSLSESGPSDYTASVYSCVKNGAPAVSGNSITLSNGDSATCTITNDDKTATLIVKKHVINDNGGVKAAGDFQLTVTGTNVAPNATFAGNEAG